MTHPALVDAWRTLVPARDDPDGPLPPALVVLTFVTGAVDAVSYLSLGHVFVANMTGNVVFVGFAVAGAPGFSVAPSLLALAGFAAGSLAGGRAAAAIPAHRGRLVTVAVAAQAALFAAAVVVSALGGAEAWLQDVLVVILGIAMGMQNAAVRSLGVSDLTTTVLTLTTTAIFADASWLGGPGGRTGRRVLSVAVMLAGALAGAAVLLHGSRTAALALALGCLTVVAVVLGALSRGQPRWAAARR